MARFSRLRRNTTTSRPCGYPTDDGPCNRAITEDSVRCWQHEHSVTQGRSNAVNRTRRQAARSDAVRLADDGFTHTDEGYEFRYDPLSPHEVEVWSGDQLVDTIVARGEHRSMAPDEVRSAATAWLMASPSRV